jgi:F-type H+-transporting ATPase subunit c
MELLAAKFIGAGLATISLAGTGVGIGIIFSALIAAYSRTPEHNKQLFTYAILGFALTEAIALFGLMIVFLILFGGFRNAVVKVRLNGVARRPLPNLE